LVGVGARLAQLSPGAVTRYRSPLITWKVVQRITTNGRTDAEILTALGLPLATGTTDKRSRRHSRTTRGKGTARAFVDLDWIHDPALTDYNPATLVRAYRMYLREVHDQVGRAVSQMIAAAQVKGSGIQLTGQSLRALSAAAKRAHLAEPSADATNAMRMWKTLDDALRPIVGSH
jgi:hypothetical protein